MTSSSEALALTRAEALRAVGMFSAVADDDREALAGVVAEVHADEGQLLWRQGDHADALYIIVEGAIAISMRLPGGGEVQLSRPGPGEVLGELGLLEGGKRSASARALAPTTLLALPRHDFLGLIASHHPSALGLRRSLLGVVCGRLRSTHSRLAALLVEPEPPAESSSAVDGLLAAEPSSAGSSSSIERLQAADQPREAYLERLPFFRGYPPYELAALLARGRLVTAPSGTVLFRHGERLDHCFVTVNGAVELAIERGESRIRLRLAGPGRAFGYLRLLDDRAASVSAVARERVVLFALPADAATALIRGSGQDTHLFLDALQRDLLEQLRQVSRYVTRRSFTESVLDAPAPD